MKLTTICPTPHYWSGANGGPGETVNYLPVFSAAPL